MSNRLDAAVMSAEASEGRLVRLGKENFRPSAASKLLVVNAAVFNPAAAGFDEQKPGELYNMHLVENDQAGAVYLLPGEGYSVELRKGSDVLYSEAFSLTFHSEYSGPSGGDAPPFPSEDSARADVSLVLPWADGTTEIVLLKGSQLLASQSLSGNKPVVEFTSPTAAEVWEASTMHTVTWQASDADGDALSYSLFYHRDGAEWELLATELLTPSYVVDVNIFAGSKDARFRVVATDGVNISMAESASVTIPDKKPIAQIGNPTDGATFTPGNLVVMQGSALDFEDGRLSDEKLKWSSDRQGELGSGPSLPSNLLEPGAHVITLSVEDSSGQSASASVTIFVGHAVYLPVITR